MKTISLVFIVACSAQELTPTHFTKVYRHWHHLGGSRIVTAACVPRVASAPVDYCSVRISPSATPADVLIFKSPNREHRTIPTGNGASYNGPRVTVITLNGRRVYEAP